MALNRFLLMAGAATAVLAVGCSSSVSTVCCAPPPRTSPASTSPAAGGTGTPTSCSVVTRTEAAAALGQAVAGPRIGNATVESGKACVWYGPSVPTSISPNIPVGDTVRVVLVTGPNAKKFFNDYHGKSPSPRWISGLGDKAFYDGFASLSVLKGNAYLRIYVGALDQLKAEEMLARDALPRM
jgi:hypothetical protein